jgi:carboxyl-terminal processing protease
MGVVKLTIQKFYRVNGGSTQLMGVIPDIKLPDTYKYIEYGEKEYDYALKYDSINSASYSFYKGGLQKKGKLVQKSSERTKEQEVFKMIDENARRVERANKLTKFSLNLESYRSFLKESEKEMQKYKDIFKASDQLMIYTMKVDQEELLKDSVKIEKITAWHEGLQKDPYLLEAIEVLRDIK